MSLHKFADMVAKQGRGDDSLLIHMTPDEVQRLQQFAQANGRSLTINPTTGLPEAGMLSDLFKMVAPIALGAFLGPAGLGMSSMMAGVATGGITTLATGSLSRGLMAGLGAYGGAGLGESFMTAGGGMSAANAASAAQGQLGAANLALGEAMPAQAAEQFTKDAVTRMTPSGAVSAGFNKAIASPTAALDFAKSNMGNLAYAAAPIAAGMMVPTTTKMPDPKDTGYIRQMAYNRNPDTGMPDPLYGRVEMAPVKASEFGNKTFQGQRDLFYQQNPNPYELGVGSLNQPPLQQPARMNTGGIVALAGGGMPGYAPGGFVPSDEDIFNYFKTPGLTDEKIAADMRAFNLSPADIARATGTQNQLADYEQRFAAQAIPAPVAPVAPVAPTYTPTFTRPSIAIEPEDTYVAPAYTPTSVYEEPANTTTQPPAGIETLTAATSPITTPTQPPAGIETLTTPVTPTAAAASTTPTYNRYTNEEIAKYLIDNPTVDIAKAIKETNADPAAVNRYIASLATPFVGSTDTTGGSGTLGIYNQMKAQGVDPNELYAASTAANPQYAGYTQPMIEKAYNLDKGAYALSDKLKGNVSDKDWVKFMDDNNYSIDDAAQAFGLSRNEVKSRYNAVKAAEVKPPVVTPPVVTPPVVTPPVVTPPVVTPPLPDPFTSVVPGGTQLPGATVYDNGAFGNYGSGPATGVDYRGNTVSIATPGDIITNPDQTRTVVPNIPGRPYGGFTGSEQVKSRYTAGGGSLGYTAPIPKDPATYYNKLTDDSLDAYNFLMGKGKNLTQRKTETQNRPVMQRYDEAVLGRKMGKPVATTATTKKVIGVPGQPQTYFNEAEYLAANPDVAAEMKSGKSNFTSAYEHWLRYGKAEGRKFAGDYEGYTTAAALAAAAGAGGGGDGPTGPSGNTGNTVSGFNPAPPDMSIPEASMGIGEGSDGNTGSTTGTGPTASAKGGLLPRGYAMGGGLGSLGSYSDGGRLLKGPGDGVSDSIPATIGRKQQPARLADGEFVIPARIVSELGNGSTDAGAKKLYAMMDRVQRARGKTTGKNKIAANSRSDKYLPA